MPRCPLKGGVDAPASPDIWTILPAGCCRASRRSPVAYVEDSELQPRQVGWFMFFFSNSNSATWVGGMRVILSKMHFKTMNGGLHLPKLPFWLGYTTLFIFKWKIFQMTMEWKWEKPMSTKNKNNSHKKNNHNISEEKFKKKRRKHLLTEHFPHSSPALSYSCKADLLWCGPWNISALHAVN